MSGVFCGVSFTLTGRAYSIPVLLGAIWAVYAAERAIVGRTRCVLVVDRAWDGVIWAAHCECGRWRAHLTLSEHPAWVAERLEVMFKEHRDG